MREFELINQQKQQDLLLIFEEQTKDKVDIVEVLKLQKQLETVQNQIERQKQENERMLREQAEKMA